MLAGKIRTCWKCNYSGKFNLSNFFLIGFVVVESFLLLTNVFMWADPGYLFRSRWGGRYNDPLFTAITVAIFSVVIPLGFLGNLKRYLYCPKCHMPASDGGDNKV